MAIVTSDKLLAFLRKKRFQELGSGLYSDVFAPVKSDRVIKICRAHILDNWPDYILWATKEGYAGHFAPKVYSLKISDGLYVASMERLKQIERYQGGGGYKDPAINEHYRAMENCAYSPNRYPLPDETEAAYPGMGKFLKELNKFFGGSMDFHRGNVMTRGNNSFVITDPCTGHLSETMPKRMRTYDLAMARNAQFANQKAYAKRA